MSETLERRYIRELTELGVYKSAFDGSIRMLAQMEREIRRVDKAWRAACAADPEIDGLDYCHPLHEKMEKLRRDILTYRESLGLTPKGYKRLRPEAAQAPQGVADQQLEALDRLTKMCEGFDAWGGAEI